jgi:hypothetical protein
MKLLNNSKNPSSNLHGHLRDPTYSGDSLTLKNAHRKPRVLLKNHAGSRLCEENFGAFYCIQSGIDIGEH